MEKRIPRRPVTFFNNENINPCIKESQLSQKCLEIELYDYSKCDLVFENYRNCKKFWGSISRRRKLAGITPSMPAKEEREKILKLKEEGIHVISAD